MSAERDKYFRVEEKEKKKLVRADRRKWRHGVDVVAELAKEKLRGWSAGREKGLGGSQTSSTNPVYGVAS